MRKLLSVVLLTLLSVPAFAQWRDDGYGRRNDGYGRRNDGYGSRNDGDYGRGRGGWGRDSRDGRRGGNSAVERTLSDLQRLSFRQYSSGRDRDRVNRAVRELQEFQSKYRQGKFDNGKLDKAIDNMKPLVNGSSLNPRDRENMMRNIDELRTFRASGGNGYGRW